MPVADSVFPLTPRRRLIGLSFGGLRSSRRGSGSDIAGSRPYYPGDDMKRIDWAASARLSSARGSDDFIVREHFAEEAPRVVVVADRRPEMSLYPSWLPWLSKGDAVRTASVLIADSTVAARGLSGYLDHAEGTLYWRPPRSQHEDWRSEKRRPFRAPQDTVSLSFAHLLASRPSLPPGTFLFVLSDFLVPPEEQLWLRAVERRWDIVPVVEQDATWEASFPDVSGTMLPVVLPRSGRVTFIRLSAAEVAARKRENEERHEQLLRSFEALALDPIRLTTSNPAAILDAFLMWSEQRMHSRVRR